MLIVIVLILNSLDNNVLVLISTISLLKFTCSKYTTIPPAPLDFFNLWFNLINFRYYSICLIMYYIIKIFLLKKKENDIS